MAYVLLSVFDKTGIIDLGKQLEKLHYKIISTSGTAKILKESGIKVIPIQEITGNPESFDGRMKTISFQIEGGILFDRKNKQHLKEAKELGIQPIDIVVCNLYPFETIPTIENIDVGGPTMIRSAAKNYKNVLVVTDPKDYLEVSEKLSNGELDEKYRKYLAGKAFYHLSFYDSQIAKFLSEEKYPEEFTLPGRKIKELRYGENPHQTGAIYLQPGVYSPFKEIKGYWGRELSLINITDINAGILSIQLFREPASVVIKHNTPCGMALGNTPEESLQRAIDADPESAFGGVVVLNREINKKCAKVILNFKEKSHGLIDIIAAPKIEDEALEILKGVRKSMGIYTFGKIRKPSEMKTNLKWLYGGFILQDADEEIERSFKSWEVVTKKKPSKEQLEQMKIAWKFLSFIRSNAVIVVDHKLPMTRGIGSGQTSRFRSTKIALQQANSYAKNAILASDSFFPFGDSVEEAAKFKVGAIIQQGDSVNDKLSINAANKAGIPMVLTHHRAFWH